MLGCAAYSAATSAPGSRSPGEMPLKFSAQFMQPLNEKLAENLHASVGRLVNTFEVANRRHQPASKSDRMIEVINNAQQRLSVRVGGHAAALTMSGATRAASFSDSATAQLSGHFASSGKSAASDPL